MKLQRNALGGLMVPVNSIGAAYKTKRKPRSIAVGLRFDPEQMALWPLKAIRGGTTPIESPVPFSQWYEARKK